MTWTTILIVMVVLFGGLAAALLYRLAVLRRGGTAVTVRKCPSAAGVGWRHGVMRYGDNVLIVYKLSSLRLGPDVRMVRQDIELGARRSPQDTELDIMTEQTTVIALDTHDRSFELGLDSGAFTAFMSWVESRPSDRSMRGKP